MEKGNTLKFITYRLLGIVLLFLSSCGLFPSKTEIKRDVNFNNGWSFLNEGMGGAEKPDFDDSTWRKLDLPHDWSVEDLPEQISETGPFDQNKEKGDDVGYLGGGTGWYRKTFTLNEDDANKQVYLHFDGVQTETSLFVNGQKVGKHVYGYTAFYFNITPYLNEPGDPNLIAVKVVNPEQNSRWFTGAGIYRNVTLSIVDPIHISTWGVAVITSFTNENEAQIDLDIRFANAKNTDEEVVIKTEIISPANRILKLEKQKALISKNGKTSITISTKIENPERWGLESPNLYTANVSVFQNNKKIDEYRTTFGIRSIKYSSEKGFLLNGKKILMKGACMHHDNGLLGAAAFERAEERRVQIMKKNGYNAIRTSHNPPSLTFLDACDRIGMLVIDESFDAWKKPKRKNDYHKHYEEWWKKDTEAMVLRDRNHPSIIMWSIGNEIQERADSSGLVIAKEAIDYIRSIDKTRPVTQAICGFWDNPGLVWDDTTPPFELMDIGGYNYQWGKYESDHEKFPGRVMYGSESVPKQAFDYWQLVKKHPYVLGDFVWTGMDYIGESGIGHASYLEDKNAKTQFLKPWPWYISWCGDIDIIGNKKPQSYYRDVVWGESKLEIAVHEPIPEGRFESVSFWGWPEETQSWNWHAELEKVPLQVAVYSTYPKVRLELNEKVIGEKEITDTSRLTAQFLVPFEAGELKVSGIENGTVSESKTLSTTGEVVALKLVAERMEIGADRKEIAYINVLALDENGNVVPDKSLRANVSVFGEGELMAAGNGAPLAQGSLQDERFNLENGRGLIIVRSTGQAGAIEIEVSSVDLEKARMTVYAK